MSETIYHNHHIIPKHFNGTDHPSNLIKLTVQEHAIWHYELWVYYGKRQDEVAWKMLAGLQKHPWSGIARPEMTGENNPTQIYIKKYGKHQSKGKKRPDIMGDNNPMRKGVPWNKGKTNLLVGDRNKQRAKQWLITDPKGQVQIIVNLKSFCKEHNLFDSNMVAVAKGRLQHNKGWKCSYLEA